MKNDQAHPSTVAAHSVVALTWTMKDMQGEVLDVLQDPVEFLLGSDDLLAAIDTALQGHQAGDTLELHLEPQNAFGDYHGDKVFLAARQHLPAELEEGMVFDGHALPADLDIPRDALYFVTDLYPEHVVLDGNHPLAGIGLNLELHIHAVRAPTRAETQAGTAGQGFFRIETGALPVDTPGTLH